MQPRTCFVGYVFFSFLFSIFTYIYTLSRHKVVQTSYVSYIYTVYVPYIFIRQQNMSNEMYVFAFCAILFCYLKTSKE